MRNFAEAFLPGEILVNRALGCLAAAIVAIVWQRMRERRTDISAIALSVVCGLVASSGGWPYVSWWAAMFIGGIAGLGYFLMRDWLRQREIVDSAGFFSAFAWGGLWGTIAVGLFADGREGAGWQGVVRPANVARYGEDTVRGLIYGDPWQLVAQVLGVAVVVLVGFVLPRLILGLVRRLEMRRAA